MMNAKRIAKDAFEKYRGGAKSDDDFLNYDAGPEYDSDEYVNPTGLTDGMDLGEVEGTGDHRKALLLKALAKLRGK